MGFYYCNPFFRRCKQNFRETEKFFDGKQHQPEKALDFKPKPTKTRPQPPSGGALPGKTPDEKPPAAAQTDVPGAQGEVVVEPDPEGGKQKDSVGEHRVLWPQGPEKAVKKPQCRPQGQGADKAVGRRRRGHRNSLRQPVWRGSS